jgi:hypothetical protein
MPFYKNDTAKVSIRLQNVGVKSKNEINVLRVLLNAKFIWCNHVTKVIDKASSSQAYTTTQKYGS